MCLSRDGRPRGWPYGHRDQTWCLFRRKAKDSAIVERETLRPPVRWKVGEWVLAILTVVP